MLFPCSSFFFEGTLIPLLDLPLIIVASFFICTAKMSNALDLSLDAIIKNSKKSGSSNTRGRGRGSGPGPGPARRFPNLGANRAAPYSTAKAPETSWKHDIYTDPGMGYGVQAGRTSSIETGTKLYISNLDYGVSNEDIKELFSEVGELKRYAIHYDRSGRSKGTGEVVFRRQVDALAAVMRYNNVQLDGKPMQIEIVGTNIAPPAGNRTFGNSNGVPRGGQGRGGAMSRHRRGGGRRSGRGHGRGRGDKVSAEDLDADLEKYHTEAMETS